jgi:hypothetical protein
VTIRAGILAVVDDEQGIYRGEVQAMMLSLMRIDAGVAQLLRLFEGGDDEEEEEDL